MALRKIGIDMDNGDVTPEGDVVVRMVPAVERFLEDHPSVEVFLHGDDGKIRTGFNGIIPHHASIVPATEFYSQEDKISRPVKGTGLNNLVSAVRDGTIEGFFSIGDTSKVALEATKIRNKRVGKPALVAVFPSVNGEFVCSDVGLTNQHSDKWKYESAIEGLATEVYRQALMATVYVKGRGVERPRWGVLSNGTEGHKGSDTDKCLDDLILNGIRTKGLGDFVNYIGRVESKDCFNGVADVVLTEGYKGNLFLKEAEASFRYLAGLVKDEMESLNLLEKIRLIPATGVLKSVKEKILSRVDPDRYGGAVILGYDGVITKGHGDSNSRAIYYGLCHLADCNKNDMGDALAEAVKEYLPK